MVLGIGAQSVATSIETGNRKGAIGGENLLQSAVRRHDVHHRLPSWQGQLVYDDSVDETRGDIKIEFRRTISVPLHVHMLERPFHGRELGLDHNSVPRVVVRRGK